MGGRDLHGGNLKDGTSEPRSRYRMIPGEAVSQYDVVQCLSRVGDHMVGTKADRDAIQTQRGPLFMARHNVLATNGNDPILSVVDKMLVVDVDTSAAQVAGAPVFLSGTAGGWTLTPPTTGFVRVIGSVVEDHATTGAWLFDGSQKSAINGIAEVANGDSTVVVTVGSALNACPVIAGLIEADGAIVVKSAVIAAGDLTITLSAGTSAARYVAYSILAG